MVRFVFLFFLTFLFFNPGAQIEYSFFTFWILSISLVISLAFLFVSVNPNKYFVYLSLLIAGKSMYLVTGCMLFIFVVVSPFVRPMLSQNSLLLPVLPVIGFILLVDLFFIIYLILLKGKGSKHESGFPVAFVTEVKEE